MNYPFYLTGGTALGRYYLGHRYSEDLDFFVNADPIYKDYIPALDNWIKSPMDPDHLSAVLRKVVDDLLLGRVNSLGFGKPDMDKATPEFLL
jgi:hypothetical protein